MKMKPITVKQLKSGQIILFNTGQYWSCNIYLGVSVSVETDIEEYFSNDRNYYNYIITREEPYDLYQKLLKNLILIPLTILPLRKETSLTEVEVRYIKDLTKDVLENGIKGIDYLGTVVINLYTLEDIMVEEEELDVCVIKTMMLNNDVKISYIKDIVGLISCKIKEFENRKEEDIQKTEEQLKELTEIKEKNLVLNKPLYIIKDNMVLPVEIVKIEKNYLFVQSCYFWFVNKPLEWLIYKIVKERGTFQYVQKKMQMTRVRVYECNGFE